MKQEIIVPECLSAGEVVEKISKTCYSLDAFDKLVNNDQLTYLPNLYLRQYKLIDELTRIRQDFPEQKLLLERPRTQWDFVIEDAIFVSRMLQERKKLKIASNASLIRQAKSEVQRSQLRAEEQYHYHRIISGALGEAVVEQFKKCTELPVLKVEEEKPFEKQGAKKNQDDIFMDGDGEYDDFNYMPGQPDILDELLAGDNDAGRMQEEHVPTHHIESVSVYMSEKYASRRQLIDCQPLLGVGRKSSLRKINESVRKRLKFKEEEDEQLNGRSLSSATVFLSTLLCSQPESKASTLIDAVSTSEWLFGGDRSRKRKDDDSLDLRWSPDEIEKLQQRNDKNCLRRGKIDAGLLMLTADREDDQFRKIFDKQIEGDKSFPPTLKNVRAAGPERLKKFYNQLHDKDYQRFIMKRNKSRLFEQFAGKANYIFPENYSQDEVEDAENISSGKLFIHKPEKLLERVVFLKEERYVRTFLRSRPNNQIDENRALLMAFLVEKYLREFGNNWKNIAQLVCRHIAFAQKFVTVQFVQEIYQMVARLSEARKNLPGIELWDKKIIPSDSAYTPNYTIFQPSNSPNRGSQRQSDSNNQSSATAEDNSPITADYYRRLIEQGVEELQEKPYEGLEREFQNFLGPIAVNIPKLVTSSEDEDLTEDIEGVLEKYEQERDVVTFDGDDHLVDHESNRHQFLIQSLKGQIKVGAPFRKKKSINQRNNELVKILQALRNKNIPNPSNPIQKKPEDSAKPNGPVAPIKASVPPPSLPSQKSDTASELKKTMKSPEKPDKKLGAPSKKDKKPKDGQDKK